MMYLAFLFYMIAFLFYMILIFLVDYRERKGFVVDKF